jgi:type IV pilus secretin PilQ/predicted competence protein
MVAPTSRRWIGHAASAAVMWWLVGALACASSPDATSMKSAGGDRLTDVRVESGDYGTLITFVGLEEPIYTAFLHSAPHALVLDMTSVEIATPNDLVMVYDGLVENVTLSTHDADSGEALTRVEIALAQNAEYEISRVADGLQAVLTYSDTEMSEEVSDSLVAGDDPWGDPGAQEIAASEMAAPEPAKPATTLIAVHVTPIGDGVLIHLEADGAISALETFTVEDPDRLVVDLPGLGNSVKTARVKVDQPRVSQLRIGAHPDKLRVVVDGGGKAEGFEERRVAPSADGLYLALGSGPELESALDEALALSESFQEIVAEEPTSDGELELAVVGDADAEGEMEDRLADLGLTESGEEFEVSNTESMVNQAAAEAFAAAAQIHGIHYDSEDEYERIVILADAVVEYDVMTPDSETVVISIPEARVSREASGRIAAAPRRPISLISTFQQPDVEVPEVRVVIKRATGLQPSVMRRGSMLFVDFPNNGLVAAPPPAFSGDDSLGTVESMRDANDSAYSGMQDAADTAAAAGMDDPYGDMAESAGSDFDAAAGETPGAIDDYETDYADDLGMDTEVATDFDAFPEPPIPGSPAALEPPAPADILEEGGLIDGKEYEGRRISLDFKDVPVADVLRLIAEVSDLNLIAGDEVEGNVTIRLVDVPWDQALDVILLTKGLGFVRVGNVLRIAPADIIKAEEELRLQERRNKETLEDLVVKLQPVNYATVADMAELVKRLLTPRGTVNTDARTNTLIIKDIPSVIDEATALIKAIDTETPQVLIEAKIVEAALDFSRELGSTWAVGTNELEDGFSGSSPRTDLGGPDFRFHDANNVIFGNPITSVPTALLNMNAFVLNEDFNVNVQIQAAESTGDGKVISSPRVLTLDNREAEIQQGVSIPFQTFENGDAKLEFIDAVLSLLVTPHVTSDKTIIMQIEVTRNAPDDSVATPTGSPAIARAETRTETLVKDGQTLVIGGIYTVNESQRESRVPYLHRLPLIGSAFRSKEVTDSRKELLIFVTPRIVLASELAGS